MSGCCEGATACIHCNEKWCREENPSSGEAIGPCVDCWALTEVTC